MRNGLRLIAVLALGILLLAGCQRGQAPEEEAPPPPAAPEAEAPPAAPEEPEPLTETGTPEAEGPEIPAEAEMPGPEEPELPSEAETPEAEEPSPPADPESLAGLLERAGYAPEDLPGEQIIVVSATGNAADIYAFSAAEDGTWEPFLKKTAGHTGRNGVTGKKAEGDRATPKGLYSITQAFGVEEDPGCLLPYRQAGAESYWVDDPSSQYYNQWVEGTQDKDWSSAEHLTDYPAQYAYAAVIDYNTGPVVPGAGSAIFLHCGSKATAGCVSMDKAALLELLTWLDPEKSPAILIF